MVLTDGLVPAVLCKLQNGVHRFAWVSGEWTCSACGCRRELVVINGRERYIWIVPE